MFRYIVLYGGLMSPDGRLDETSAARCDTALRVANSFKDSAIIIFSVDWTIPNLRGATLRYLKDWGWPSKKMLSPPEAHDTFGETKAALRILREDDCEEVVIVSSRSHLWRIRAMWKYLGFHGTIVPCSSKDKHPIKAWLWEIGAFAKFFKRRLFREI